MAYSKLSLSLRSIAGLLILVYGTSILYGLLFGKYLMVDGLMDINYLLLFLFCAVPIVLGIFINNNNALNMILMISLFFGTLFILVHGALVFSVLEMTTEILARILTVIPISALIIVVVSYFVIDREHATN
ncbi:hypothetical protein [Psychrobacillus vulpis]|uniref:Uncharacterized protein n=1 Tax=Psychrobacillus vulpis TaxID=2325572 RepID=A0A544TNR6_9BACI|nr:hypothetical protein [Psychrobacillus vulpis]TQR19084.1 hypothetical protein FG384_14780 [Psychrobacillus vulpis]